MKISSSLLCVFSASTLGASAFTFDFLSQMGTELADPAGAGQVGSFDIDVPGYGTVTFSANPGSDLVVDENFNEFDGGPFKTLRFTDGDSVNVTFNDATPAEISIDYIGVGLTEDFAISNIVNNPGSYSFDIDFSSGALGDAPGAGIQKVSFIPEPSSSLMMVLAGIGFAARRRR